MKVISITTRGVTAELSHEEFEAISGQSPESPVHPGLVVDLNSPKAKKGRKAAKPAESAPAGPFSWSMAHSFLLKGSRIRREHWEPGEYLEYGQHAPFATYVKGANRMARNNKQAREDHQAMDWHVVEESK